MTRRGIQALGSVLRSYDGARRPIKAADRVPGDTPYLGASGVVDWVRGKTHDGEYLCVSEDGENLRSRRTPIAWVQTGEFWANNHVHVFGGVSVSRLRFFEGALAVTNVAPYLTGSAQPKLTQAAAQAVMVPMFNALEQEAIGEVLGALSRKIASNRELSQGAWSLLAESFARSATATPSQPVFRISELLLGGTPARGNPDYWGGDVPWINSGACNSRIIMEPSECITALGLAKSAAKMLPRGSTCVAITGATLGQMGWLSRDMSANQSVVGVAAVPEERLWMHFALQSEREQLLQWATGGAQQHVNKEAVGSVRVPYTSQAARAFGREFSPLMSRLESAERENVRIGATRDELLPLLMNGKITVKDAEKTVEDVV